MCHPVRCCHCGKTTWAGCGEHIADVKVMIAPSDWCSGHPDLPASTGRPLRWLERLRNSTRQ